MVLCASMDIRKLVFTIVQTLNWQPNCGGTVGFPRGHHKNETHQRNYLKKVRPPALILPAAKGMIPLRFYPYQTYKKTKAYSCKYALE